MPIKNLGYKIHYTRGSDLTAASTLAVDGSGDFFVVSGSTGITRLADKSKGTRAILSFSGAPLLTHNDTYLDLPDDENWQVVAGEILTFVQYDSGDGTTGKWRFIAASDTSGGGGTNTFSSDQTIANLGDSRIDNNGDFTDNIDGWTHTGGWAWNSANSGCARHTAGSAGSLSSTITTDSTSYYYGEFTVANRTAGYVVLTVGVYVLPFDGESTQIDENGTFYGGVRSFGAGDKDVIIAPSSNFDGDIVSVKFWKVETPSVPQVYFIDEAEVTACTMLADDTLNNTFLGTSGGIYAYTGHDNICVGKNAGQDIITASYNTLIGRDAGKKNSMGLYNTCVGSHAGEDLVTGSANTLIGKSAGASLLYGSRNTCIGVYSGSAMTTATDNLFFGPFTGQANTSGTHNVGIGSKSLIANENGFYNVAIGAECLQANVTGGGNVAIGFNSQNTQTNGLANISIGRESMEYKSAGVYNVAMGYRAYRGQTGTHSTGDGNTAIGGLSGEFLTTGQYNALLGGYAGYNLEDGTGNTCIGYRAGEHYGSSIDSTSNTNGIFIGNECETGAIDSSNEIVIGYDAKGAGSNKIKIGNTSHTDTYLMGTIHTEGQVKFPSTQSASADANTLDDYKEGTFTPYAAFSGGSSGITYSMQSGNYTKIGRTVTAHGTIILSSKGTSTGTFRITGLPYTTKPVSGGYRYPASVRISGVTHAGDQIFLDNSQDSTTLIPWSYVAATGVLTQLDDGDITNTSAIAFSITYPV